jgi:hypothetical protein
VTQVLTLNAEAASAQRGGVLRQAREDSIKRLEDIIHRQHLRHFLREKTVEEVRSAAINEIRLQRHRVRLCVGANRRSDDAWQMAEEKRLALLSELSVAKERADVSRALSLNMMFRCVEHSEDRCFKKEQELNSALQASRPPRKVRSRLDP